MAGIKTFKDLLVWRKAHELVLLIYKLSEAFPKSEEFGLKLQIRRAAVSIASNIAEGFKRKNKKDSCHFYNMAEGSLEEVKYQIFLASDLSYVEKADYQKVEISSEEVGKLLCGWIKVQK